MRQVIITVFEEDPHDVAKSLRVMEGAPDPFERMHQHTTWTAGSLNLLPRPSPLGRGRMVRRLSSTTVPEFRQQLLAKHASEARCSLSPRERVRVRGKYSVPDGECSISERLFRNVGARGFRKPVPSVGEVSMLTAQSVRPFKPPSPPGPDR